MFPNRFILLLICFSNILLSKQRLHLGRQAKPGQFPHLVSLRLFYWLTHSCSGNIISDRHILTVASCFDYYHVDISDAIAVTGTVTLDRSGVFHKLKYKTSHSQYQSSNLKNNLAVVTVADVIQFDSFTQKICLELSEIGPSSSVVSTNWGCPECELLHLWTDYVSYAEVTTVPLNDCKYYWRYYSVSVTEDNICTNAPRFQGVCSGDKGGSLLHEGHLVGVISHGPACAAGEYDTFIRVSKFLVWIRNAMQS